jgi:hypothetical protein
MYCSCGWKMIPVIYYRSKRWAEEARLCTHCGKLRLFNIEKGIIRLVPEWNRIAVRRVG